MNYKEYYEKITKDCPFNTNPTDVFYYAEQDHINTNLLARNCIEIDIKAAFPTLCRFIFGESHPFVQKLFEFTDKFERNKFIAIQLTHSNYDIDLKTLNAWCKFLILGYVYNNFININLIEYKKDGVLFTGTYNYDNNEEFNKYIEKDVGVTFHIDKVDIYIRFNKTSLFKYQDKIEVKGKYKDPPDYLLNIILPKALAHELEVSDMIDIKKYYSDIYFKVLKMGDMGQDLKYYYKFANKYINQKGDLEIIPTKPINVLVHFLYPIISILKLEK